VDVPLIGRVILLKNIMDDCSEVEEDNFDFLNDRKFGIDLIFDMFVVFLIVVRLLEFPLLQAFFNRVLPFEFSILSITFTSLITGVTGL